MKNVSFVSCPIFVEFFEGLYGKEAWVVVSVHDLDER